MSNLAGIGERRTPRLSAGRNGGSDRSGRGPSAGTVADVNRREFFGVATATTAYASLAAEMAASIAAGDSGPLATVQTSHTADWITASVLDRAAAGRLVRWVEDEPSPVARVNAAGMLAKVPGRRYDDVVAGALERDLEVRRLYSTAVAARVLGLPWPTASAFAAEPRTVHAVSGTGAGRGSALRWVEARLSREAAVAADAGARWCSAAMLRDLTPAAGR